MIDPEQLTQLHKLLRPPGKGIPTFSTGGGYASGLLQSIYGTEDMNEVVNLWRADLTQIKQAKKILIGIPSDTGACIVRGSNFGPLGVRVAYQNQFGNLPDGVLDVGDVFSIPQFVHDGMIDEATKRSVRAKIYSYSNSKLPVGPLSVAEFAISTIRRINPDAKIFMIGGDHGVTWPMLKTQIESQNPENIGVLQIDAHTDLSPSRLGIKHCYNTWAYHTLGLLKERNLVQVGIRASTKTKQQWTAALPVVQFWMEDVSQNADKVIADIIQHFVRQNISKIYITNDIDGTDCEFAPATGTPEPNGLSPQFVKKLVTELQEAFEIVGGDVVEVAPPLAGTLEYGFDATSKLGAEYLALLLN